MSWLIVPLDFLFSLFRVTLTVLRLPYTFRSTIFLKSGFLGQTIGRAVISNLKQKLDSITRQCGFLTEQCVAMT